MRGEQTLKRLVRRVDISLKTHRGVIEVVQRVLVVEDSAVIQRLISVCLRPAGVEVETRADGPTGLEAALTTQPDLLILDVGLPRMDGWEVLDRIRSDIRTRSMKVLVLTAHAQEETRERADRGGADAFLTKPFRPDDLRSVALALLGGPVVAIA